MKTPEQRIAPEHADKPNFRRMVAEIGGLFADEKTELATMLAKFDLDHARGDQLDVLGQWIGLPRDVKAPIQDVYFTWHGNVDNGWKAGVWRGKFGVAYDLERLPDDVYRRVLKAKASANAWDGTTEALAAYLKHITESDITIHDNGDLTLGLTISGHVPKLIRLLIKQEYVALRPAGVALKTLKFEGN